MQKIKKDALGNLVYGKIKLMILNGALKPGQKINKKELTEQLSVSQTPVNEAIIRLTGEGLIEQQERKGFFIKIFTYQDLKEFFAIRAGMEGVALRLCVEEQPDNTLDKLTHFFDNFSLPLDENEYKKYLKADQEFHQKIIELSRNSIIINFNKNFDFIMKSYQKGLIRPPEETLPEHKAIVKAVRNRDSEKAQQLLIEHHLKSRKVIKDQHLKYNTNN
ncbi:MAG: hypothetical protein DRP57_04440 [Spirochaetes bacterium]|nr:MAG: hypothetical protein DRP57_04440 [Spirochaetota bacterium]